MEDQPVESGQPVPVIPPTQHSATIAWLRNLAANRERRAAISRWGTIIWLALVAVLAAFVIFKGREELRSTFHELRTANLVWVGIAIAVQAASIFFNGASYGVVLKRLGRPLSLWQTTNAQLQRTAISTVTPIGGPASVFAFVRYVGHLGVPAEDALVTIAVRSAGVNITFIALLIPGAYLNHTTRGYIVAAIASAAFLLFAVLFWKANRDNWETAIRGASRLPGWLSSRMTTFITQFRDHGLKPVDLLWPTILSLLVRITIITVLYASLKALGEDPSLSLMVNAYFASILASTVIPVFQGAGAVEAVVILTLKQGGVPADIAIGATLLWRLIDLWIPVGIGLILHAAAELPAAATGGAAVAAAAEYVESGEFPVRDE